VQANKRNRQLLRPVTGQTPSTGAVRSFRTKNGLGLNFEQQLDTDFGIFARAGVSQGTVEEVDFTDINQSISAGFTLTGSRWGRPNDTVGVASVANRISHQGKLYLAAGGLGGIIGHGRLLNAGPEQILEAYYRVAVFSFAHFAFDYQFINHERQRHSPQIRLKTRSKNLREDVLVTVQLMLVGRRIWNIAGTGGC
jgi:high affinity Mn2+ porin